MRVLHVHVPANVLSLALLSAAAHAASAEGTTIPRRESSGQESLVLRQRVHEEKLAAGQLEGDQRHARLQRAYELALEARKVDSSPIATLRQSPVVAWRAYDAGQYDVAELAARDALAEVERLSDWPPARALSGWTVFHAHTVLGLLAVREGGIDTAVEHLRASVQHAGSPTLNSFGPNTRLAVALLEHGRRDAVLAYFDDCREFWAEERGRLDRWKRAVEAGHVPEFGPNLAYGP